MRQKRLYFCNEGLCRFYDIPYLSCIMWKYRTQRKELSFFYKNGLFAILLFYFSVSGFSQYNPFTSIYEFDKKSGKDPAQDTLLIPSVFMEVHHNIVSTQELREAFPGTEIPDDSIHILFPDLRNYTDTAGLLWLLKKEDGSGPSILSLMIIGMSPDSMLHYYVDFNNDGNYTDKSNPVILDNDEPTASFTIKDRRKGNYFFTFQNPVFGGKNSQDQSPVYIDYAALKEKSVLASARNDSSWRQSRKILNLSFKGGFFLGPGKTMMEFSTLYDERVKHRKYVSDIFSSGGLQSEIGLSYKGFSAGISLSAEILMYSGYREYFTRLDPNSMELETNWSSHGKWPSTRVSYGGFLEYDFILGSDMRLAPYASYSKYDILSNHYFIRSIPGNVGKDFIDLWMYSAGLKLKFLTGMNQMLYLSASYQSSYFDARPYFDDVDPKTYSMWARQYCLGMGFQFRYHKN